MTRDDDSKPDESAPAASTAEPIQKEPTIKQLLESGPAGVEKARAEIAKRLERGPKPGAAPPEPTVKELLERGKTTAALAKVVDPKTRAELERWFSLPSFTELAERPPPEPTREEKLVAEGREQRDKAIAALDPAFMTWMFDRLDRGANTVKPRNDIDVRVDPTIAFFDQGMVDRQHLVAEPRSVERPEDIEDQLKDCTPQALLRDLHRPELTFDKQFDRRDIMAEIRVDAVALCAEAIRASHKLPPPVERIDLRALTRDTKALLRTPWTDIAPHRKEPA